MAWELLQQVRILDPGAEIDRPGDVLLAPDGSFTLDPPPDRLDASVVRHPAQGQIFAPGLVDLGARSGEPGFEERETWASLEAAALAGGFTQVAVFPTTIPALDRGELVAQRCQRQGKVRWHHWGAMTQGCQGSQMTDLAELAAAGVVGFGEGRPLQDWGLIRRILEYGSPLGKPLMFWPWDLALAGSGVVWEGSIALRSGLNTLSYLTQTLPLAGLIECVAQGGSPLHLWGVTTARGVALVRQAQAQHLPITASTPWHGLLHSTLDLHDYNPHLRLCPPVGNPRDRVALLEAVADGTIAAIASDHTPHTYEEKTVAFGEAPPGAIGLPLLLPLLWHHLVCPGHLSALDLWQRLSVAPAQILNLPSPSLTHQRGGWVWFDPQAHWTATPATLGSRSHNTPYLGQDIPGRVIRAVLPPFA
jgi:dihydroorotase